MRAITVVNPVIITLCVSYLRGINECILNQTFLTRSTTLRGTFGDKIKGRQFTTSSVKGHNSSTGRSNICCRTCNRSVVFSPNIFKAESEVINLSKLFIFLRNQDIFSTHFQHSAQHSTHCCHMHDVILPFFLQLEHFTCTSSEQKVPVQKADFHIKEC